MPCVIGFPSDLSAGYWYMHCHVEFHNNAGMSLVIKEGTDDQISKPPAAINTCGDFFFPQNNQASEDPFENCPGKFPVSFSFF